MIRLRLTLFGGSPEEPDPRPFGFTGRCEALDLTTDIDPLGDR